MKKLLTTLIGISLAVNTLASDVWHGDSTPWIHGSGTVNDPYLIETAANLAYLAEKVNEGYQAQGMEVFKNIYFMMTDDIDLNNINWTPIGNVDYVNSNIEGFYFAGVFNGWFHNIDNLKIQTSDNLTGLFAGLGGDGEVVNLSVNGSIISGGLCAGGIAGAMAGKSHLDRCSYSGTISISKSGQFCGAGGIVGAAAENSSISRCSFSGNINANNGNPMGAAGAGGITGVAINNAVVEACYNTGNITATATMISVAAGILGATLNDANIHISDCYNVGTLNANTKGGIFGMISPINPFKEENSIDAANCYYLNTCGGTTNYGTGMTESQMRSADFVPVLNEETNSNFVMDNGTNNGYPILSLWDILLHEGSDITAHSVKLSARIHQGNLTLSRVCFDISDMNNTFSQTIDVPTDSYVETIVENLEENTAYRFCISIYVEGNVITTSNMSYFTTGFDGFAEIPDNDILIYPNPTSDLIFIENIKPQSVIIYSPKGKMIKTVENTNIIDVRDLNKGIYLINIDGMTRRIVII